MRIIAGKYRHRKLYCLEGQSIRPTLDRVKESLFSILTPKIPGARVVDFFAGTGNMAIEAISRGASFACLVDQSRDSIQVIQKNLDSLGLRDEVEVWNLPHLSAIHKLKQEKAKFDIVFLDPPYGKNLVPECLQELADAKLLVKGAVIVAEHHIKEELPQRVAGLVQFRHKLYGQVSITLFKHQPEKHG